MLRKFRKGIETALRWATSNLAWEHGGAWVLRGILFLGWIWSVIRGNPIIGLFVVVGLWLLVETALTVRAHRRGLPIEPPSGGSSERGVRVVHAEWGVPGRFVDVTRTVRAAVVE